MWDLAITVDFVLSSVQEKNKGCSMTVCTKPACWTKFVHVESYALTLLCSLWAECLPGVSSLSRGSSGDLFDFLIVSKKKISRKNIKKKSSFRLPFFPYSFRSRYFSLVSGGNFPFLSHPGHPCRRLKDKWHYDWCRCHLSLCLLSRLDSWAFASLSFSNVESLLYI